jgi:mRNA interferase HicA
MYVNRLAGKVTAVPRHREINDFLISKICKDLDIPQP